jgi:hypothetical protein
MERRDFLQLSAMATATASAMPLSAWEESLAAPPPGEEWKRPAVDAPAALVADGGDQKARLEWNPNLEEDVAGYRLYRRRADEQDFEPVSEGLLERPQGVDQGLENGQPAAYAVAAVLEDGTESKLSNEATVAPRATTAPETEEGTQVVEVPGFEPIRLEEAVRVQFENGHQLVFDKRRARVRDWQTREGQHLLYPHAYGNAVDLAAFNAMGFSEPRPATRERPVLPPTINLNYGDAEEALWYVGHEARGDKVTFHYRLPLSGPGMPKGAAGSHGGIWADLWETWGPAGRAVHDTTYQGLSRKIELEVPDYYDEGYAVCLNDGLGLGGSCEGALTYQLQWERPHLARKRWRSDEAQQQEMGAPRDSRGFHPTKWAVQSNPFLFLHYDGEGTMLVAPRHYHHATTYCLTNYAGQGQDGLWPNFKIDCAAAGERHTVETFEYLWTPNTSVKAPQKFMDASFHYRRRLADLYGLNPHLSSMDYAWEYWGPSQTPLDGLSIEDEPMEEKLQILEKWGERMAERADEMNADLLGGAHELWTSSPYTVPEEIRLDPEHPINQAIAQVTEALEERSVGFSYWVRPEFVKTAVPNVLSEDFPTDYYGYTSQKYPPAEPIVKRRGLRLIREHPEWIRVGREGTYPERTPYHWTPMSLTKPDGWYENVVYKSLVIMKKLGYDVVLQDGGFPCLTGVDYTGGQTRAVQPYYWRFYRDVNRLGMVIGGECILGWGNNNLGGPAREDMDRLWAYVQGVHRGDQWWGGSDEWFTPELRHRSHQMYVGTFMKLSGSEAHAEVAAFAQDFLAEHGHPDRVYLEGLQKKGVQQEWTWDDVWWEYENGRRVRYPDYGEI